MESSDSRSCWESFPAEGKRFSLVSKPECDRKLMEPSGVRSLHLEALKRLSETARVPWKNSQSWRQGPSLPSSPVDKEAATSEPALTSSLHSFSVGHGINDRKQQPPAAVTLPVANYPATKSFWIGPVLNHLRELARSGKEMSRVGSLFQPTVSLVFLIFP